MKTTIFIALITLIAAGCGLLATRPLVTEMTTEQIAAQTSFQSDRFSQVDKLIGMPISAQITQSGTYYPDRYEARMRSFYTEYGTDKHQIYLSVTYYGSWRFYRSATMEGGRRLDFDNLDKSVVSCALDECQVREVMTAAVGNTTLQKAKQTGLTVRFGTRYSNRFTDIYFPPNYITAYLSVADTRSKASY